MRIVRYLDESSQPKYGWVFEEHVGEIEGDIFMAYQRNEADISLSKVKLLAPVVPRKVICVGRNYAAHAEEHDAEIPQYPLIFLKPPTTVIGPGESIVLPPQSQQVEHEGELAIVIGKKGRWLSMENASDVVFGYTIANDVTARDLQRQDGQWTRGKGFDTFCPVGPWIDTDFTPIDTVVSCRVNGELRQMATTRDMIFSVAQIIVFISSFMTLEPGDLILTGTPSGVGSLNAGDRVSVTIERLGELTNPVIVEQR